MVVEETKIEDAGDKGSLESHPFSVKVEPQPQPKDETSQNTSTCKQKLPIVIVVIGMAGSGKTTMIKALWNHFNTPVVISSSSSSKSKTNISEAEQRDQPGEHTETKATDNDDSENTEAGPRTREKRKTYIINLDPAVTDTPYPVNIDIRDTIKYKNVMKQYKLGPNGAIMTSLNLFATKFDEVHELLKKRASQVDVVLIDTPGQIEVFNWSASGSIILDTLAISYPTVVLYVLDTARCQSPVSFMSNMMYACAVMYKAKLPFIMALNKVDACSPEQCKKWMRSYDAYAADVTKEDSYMARGIVELSKPECSPVAFTSWCCSLSRSCSLAMNEFYEGIRSVGISAATRQGLECLEVAFEEARQEYYEQYLPWLEEQRQAVQQRRQDLKEAAAKRFVQDRRKATLSSKGSQLPDVIPEETLSDSESDDHHEASERSSVQSDKREKRANARSICIA